MKTCRLFTGHLSKKIIENKSNNYSSFLSMYPISSEEYIGRFLGLQVLYSLKKKLI